MNETIQRFCIFGLFGAALALFFWKHAGASAADEARPLEKADVPTQIGLAYVPAEIIVGMSVLPCEPDELAGPAIYTSNVPATRPAMPATRSIVR